MGSALSRPATASRTSRTKRSRPTRISAGHGVHYLDGFLSRGDCARILEELESAYWKPSLTYQKQPDGNYVNVLTGFRISDSAHEEWFSTELKSILRGIERRLQKLYGVEPSHLEPGRQPITAAMVKFDYHLDAGYWTNHYAGEHLHTFLLYLNTPEKGGGTDFRALDIYVPAQAGRLLVWNNLFPDGECDCRMIHSATPLLKGKKTTLVTWQRQNVFRTTEHGSSGGGE